MTKAERLAKTEADRLDTARARKRISDAADAVWCALGRAEDALREAKLLLEPIAGESLLEWIDNDTARPQTQAESLLQYVNVAMEEDFEGLTRIATYLDRAVDEKRGDRIREWKNRIAATAKSARKFAAREAEARAAGVDLEALEPEDRRLFLLPAAAWTPERLQRRNEILAAAAS